MDPPRKTALPFLEVNWVTEGLPFNYLKLEYAIRKKGKRGTQNINNKTKENEMCIYITRFLQGTSKVN